MKIARQMWSHPRLNVESYVEPLRSPRSGLVVGNGTGATRYVMSAEVADVHEPTQPTTYQTLQPTATATSNPHTSQRFIRQQSKVFAHRPDRLPSLGLCPSQERKSSVYRKLPRQMP